MLLDPHKRITIADSTTVQVLRMSRGRGPQPCIYTCMNTIRTLKIVKSMSELDGSWKHQNIPTCTKSVRVFIILKLDTVQYSMRMKNSRYLTSLHAVIHYTSLLNLLQVSCFPLFFLHSSSYSEWLYI